MIFRHDRVTALPTEPAAWRHAAAVLAAWLWVIGVMIAYLAQFAGYVRPIVALLG
jgi:hypothetical protein